MLLLCELLHNEVVVEGNFLWVEKPSAAVVFLHTSSTSPPLPQCSFYHLLSHVLPIFPAVLRNHFKFKLLWLILCSSFGSAAFFGLWEVSSKLAQRVLRIRANKSLLHSLIIYIFPYFRWWYNFLCAWYCLPCRAMILLLWTLGLSDHHYVNSFVHLFWGRPRWSHQS